MEYVSIHIDKKYGGFDFSVSAEVGNFTCEQMKEFRQIMMVAVGQAENMFKRGYEQRPENQAMFKRC